MPDKTQTLVILSPGFPKNEADSTCLPLQQQLLKSIRHLYPGIQLQVLTFQYPFIKQNYTWNGIQVKAFGGKSRGHLFKWHNQMQIWHALEKILKTNHVLGILSFWLGECAFIGEQFAKKHQLKHYCWVLGQDAKAGNGYVKRSGINGRSLIALSDFIARNMYINYSLMPRHIVPGGINPSSFSNEQVEKHIDIIGAGSLIPLKQFHLFIEIVRCLRLKFPAIKAVICGDGPQKAQLKKLIARQGLQKNIELLGEVPHQEVVSLMQGARVLLHTSEYEGLGMVCLEALFAGARVVSFSKPFNNAITNWHIATNTKQAVNTISGILVNPNIIYLSVIPFHADAMAKNIVSLYREIPPATDLNFPAIALKESVEV